MLSRKSRSKHLYLQEEKIIKSKDEFQPGQLKKSLVVHYMT